MSARDGLPGLRSSTLPRISTHALRIANLDCDGRSSRFLFLFHAFSLSITLSRTRSRTLYPLHTLNYRIVFMLCREEKSRGKRDIEDGADVLAVPEDFS